MIKEFHSWNVLLDPVLPAREVVVAYLNECGFSMFEPHEKGVLVHGDVEEVDEQEAEMQLEAVAAFAKVRVGKHRVAQENWNAKWDPNTRKWWWRMKQERLRAPYGRLSMMPPLRVWM